jgi:anti-sigma factor RsiW
MSGRNAFDAFSDDLLSAYLDGELTSEQRAEVERVLAASAEHRQFMEELRVLCELLRQLPRYQLDERVVNRILQETQRLAQDPITDELLGAYLDGELTSDEREKVERVLAASAEHRQLMQELRVLCDDLRQLPRYELDSGIADRILEKTRRLAESTGLPSGTTTSFTEELSAYLDRELSGEELNRVEEQLRTSRDHRDMLEQLRGLEEDLRCLPTYHLDEGFAARVVRRAEQEKLAAEREETASVEPVAPVPLEAAPAAGLGWRGFVYAALAVAAAVLLMVYFRGTTDERSEPLVFEPRADDLDRLPLPPDEPTAPADDVRPPEDRRDRDRPPGMAPTMLVSQPLLQELVMVYEVTVTPEGVEKAAFANLLRRHRIRFFQTVPVDEDEQKELLKYRFLEGVELDPENEEEMDEVELYLVSCLGWQADDIYADLRSGPEGIGAVFLNLTMRSAGNGALGRLCDASGIEEKPGEAVQLAVNFAIFSRTARNLGAFGGMFVEPELYAPPAVKVAPPQEDAPSPKISREAALGGNFRCRVLFVVRNLKPLDDDVSP